MSTVVFVGIQILSVALAAAILSEYWRVCRKRVVIFQRLGSSATGKHTQFLLIALYAVTTLLIILASSVIFIRQSPF